MKSWNAVCSCVFLFAIVGVTGIFWKRIWDLREEQIRFIRLAEEVKTVRVETEVMEHVCGFF